MVDGKSLVLDVWVSNGNKVSGIEVGFEVDVVGGFLNRAVVEVLVGNDVGIIFDG